MGYKLNIKPSVNLNIQFDVVKNITTNYTMHVSASSMEGVDSDWASDSRLWTKNSVKYNTNINYNTLNATELYTYACKPFESGSQVIDTFLNNNGHSFSSYSVVTSSFTENQYWAESPNNSLPTMSVSPYSGVCGLHFQQKYFIQVEVEE